MLLDLFSLRAFPVSPSSLLERNQSEDHPPELCQVHSLYKHLGNILV